MERLRRLQSLRPKRTRASVEGGASGGVGGSAGGSVLKPRGQTSAVYARGSASEDAPTTGAPRTYAAPVRRNAPLEELVPGEARENEGGTYYVSTERYPVAGVRGGHTVENLLGLTPTTIAPLHPNAKPAIPEDFRRAAFLDTETTGLGGGASTYAFMVGVGTFEPGEAGGHDYVVRQFFMRSPAEEAGLLVGLAELLRERDLLVTFNGRTFDVPLLRMRYMYNRPFLPEEARSVPLFGDRAPHLDLLHPARRIWKRRLQSCRLVNLEEKILGVSRSGEDIPGALIPQMYVDYVKSGNGWEMGRVFYHNREDIVSTAALAAHLGRMILAPEDPSVGVTAYEWLALGERMEASGALEQAVDAYRRAIEEDSPCRGEGFNRLAMAQKRMGDWQGAAATWEAWLTSLPDVGLTPYVELAKYHEWRTRDYAQAAMWAAWALHNLKAGPAWQRPAGSVAEIEARLARLDRKMGGVAEP